MLAHVPSFGRNPRSSPDFLAYPVPKACMHVLGTGVPRCLGVACSASSPKAAQGLGCSLTPGLWISFGRLTCMARAASVPGLWTLGFLLFRCACVWVWVVVGFAFRLRPATPGWGVGVCVRLCARFACTLPLLAGVWCVCVCAGAQVSIAPRHTWLGCAVWVCVLRLGFRLRHATPGWGVGVCVCLCACCACTPPLLAGACGRGVCAWARVAAAPRHSWLGCWGVFVFVGALRLYPVTPGWGVWCGRGCLGSGCGCSPPVLAGVLGCVCVYVRAPLVPRHSLVGCAVRSCVLGCGFRLRPATPGWDLKVLPWVVDGAGGLGAGKTSGAGTRGVDLNAAVGGRTGYTDTNGGESSNNGSKIHADCYPAKNPSL